jgi:biotin carboxyl carrier protein
MQYEVDIGGRRRLVVVTRAGDGFAVSVDGHRRNVDAARIDGHTLSLVVDNALGYEVSIAADPVSGQLAVHVGSTPIAVTLNGRRRSSRKDERGGAGSGPQRLAAPMPGKVVRVLVKTGDRVHARQPIVVVEAMKMENELRASREGTVTEIHVREGMSVDAGALLLVIQ